MIDLVNMRRELAKIPTMATPDVQATLKRIVREIEQAQKVAESAAALAAAVPHIPKPQRPPTARSLTVQHLGPHSILTTAALHGWSA